MSRLCRSLFLNLVIFAIPPAFAVNGSLTLPEALHLAKENSLSLKSSRFALEAAEDRAAAVDSGRLPKLSLDGNYRTQGVVPEVTAGPKVIPLSDHHSYSIGPTLSYTLWDSGSKENSFKAFSEQAKSKDALLQLSERQVELNTRLSYLQAALQSAIILNSARALDFSQAQHKDIAARYRSGTVSKLDALASEAEVTNYQLKVQQAQADFKSSLLELSFMIGRTTSSDLGITSLDDLYADTPPPGDDYKVTAKHPAVELQQHLEGASQSLAEQQRAGRGPQINIVGRSSLDYPNGPKFEAIHQNTVALNLSWTLYEFGTTQRQVAGYQAEASAAAAQKMDTLAQLERDYGKAITRTTSLREQIQQAELLVTKQEQLTRLNLSTFQIGKLSLLEVNTANLRLLEAKTKLSQLKAQFLGQVYSLIYLSESRSHDE